MDVKFILLEQTQSVLLAASEPFLGEDPCSYPLITVFAAHLELMKRWLTCSLIVLLLGSVGAKFKLPSQN